MYNKSVILKQTTYQGIALICDAYVSSLLTDTYGDVPYFDADKGRDGVLQPKFDKQQDIYADLFKKLETANTLLATPSVLTADQLTLDPFIGTSIRGK
jgi:hypothetical protein